MDRNDASALADLQMHWDEAYVIGLERGVWSALFRGSADELQARTSSDLRELIRADYIQRQRPRPGPGPAAATLADGPADPELTDPELADPELADPELADPELPEPEPGTARPAHNGAGLVRGGSPADFAGLRGERMST